MAVTITVLLSYLSSSTGVARAPCFLFALGGQAGGTKVVGCDSTATMRDISLPLQAASPDLAPTRYRIFAWAAPYPRPRHATPMLKPQTLRSARRGQMYRPAGAGASISAVPFVLHRRPPGRRARTQGADHRRGLEWEARGRPSRMALADHTALPWSLIISMVEKSVRAADARRSRGPR